MRKQYRDYQEPQNQTKIYDVLITQSDTNIPTTTILENTLGETPIFARSSAGIYTLNVVEDLFVKTKTGINYSILDPIWTSINQVTFGTGLEGSGTNIDSIRLTINIYS